MQEHMDEIEAEFSPLHEHDNREELEQNNKQRHSISIFFYLSFLLIPSIIFLLLTPIFQNSSFVYKEYTATEHSLEIAALDVNSFTIINKEFYLEYASNYEAFLREVYEKDGYVILMHTYAEIYTEDDFLYENNVFIGLKEETLTAILDGSKTTWSNNAKIEIVVPNDAVAIFYLNSEVFDPLILVKPIRTTTADFENVFSFVIYLIFTLVMIYLMKPSLQLDYPLIKKHSKSEIFNKTVSGVFTIFVVNFIAALASQLLSLILRVPQEISQNQLSINRSLSSPWMILMVITAVLLAPVMEELVFRKAFFALIKNQRTALIVSSVIFGLIHVTTELFSGDISLALVTGLTYIAGGISLGLIYMSNKKNIYIPILVHMAYNLVGMLIQIFSM